MGFLGRTVPSGSIEHLRSSLSSLATASCSSIDDMGGKSFNSRDEEAGPYLFSLFVWRIPEPEAENMGCCLNQP